MKSRLLVTALFAVILTGCGSAPKLGGLGSDGLPASDSPLKSDIELVTSNLVYALSQVQGLHPINTTVQMSHSETPYGQAVTTILRDAGYGIQKVDSDVGPKYVKYKFEESTTERGPIKRYTMSIGDVEISRDFSSSINGLVPDSAMVITGVPESFIELNDKIFEGTGNNYQQAVLFVESTLPDFSSSVPVVQIEKPTSPAIESIKQNLYETRRSNYAALFAQYKDVDSQILVFPNDSLSLGVQNKKAIEHFASQMNQDTDLISIIGCSHGRTNVENGNSVLAIGRANRVKEAFVYAGIEYGKVLEEGCWAGHYFDEMMPRRGVVMTLMRQKG